ncbi:unnamed protein product [Meloidogyne enterolobii]|uniref:Uncharacterized protein n=1 Tax=Meloidogyne enterolobii TaxID=390850 RepID=A0ACB1APL3_MELEN
MKLTVGIMALVLLGFQCIVDNKIVISFLVFILVLFIGGFSLLKIVQEIESISDAAVLKARIAIIDGTLVVVILIVILFAVLLFILDKWFKDVDLKVMQTTDPIVTNQRSQNNSSQQNNDRNEGDGGIQGVHFDKSIQQETVQTEDKTD